MVFQIKYFIKLAVKFLLFFFVISYNIDFMKVELTFWIALRKSITASTRTYFLKILNLFCHEKKLTYLNETRSLGWISAFKGLIKKCILCKTVKKTLQIQYLSGPKKSVQCIISISLERTEKIVWKSPWPFNSLFVYT